MYRKIWYDMRQWKILGIFGGSKHSRGCWTSCHILSYRMQRQQINLSDGEREKVPARLFWGWSRCRNKKFNNAGWQCACHCSRKYAHAMWIQDNYKATLIPVIICQSKKSCSVQKEKNQNRNNGWMVHVCIDANATFVFFSR